VAKDDPSSELSERIAASAAHLIALFARDAPTDRDEAWYWDKAIHLLDRLCDVGAEGRTLAMRVERLEELTNIVEAVAPTARHAGTNQRSTLTS
jgi:hypothetical protein